MLRKGYVEQQIDALGKLLGQLLKLKDEGKYADALTELRTGCKKLTGLDIDTVSGLPEPTLLMMLGGGNSVRDFLEVGKCVTLSALLREQAGLYRLERREDAAVAAERKALMLLTEALIHEPSLRRAEYRERVDALAASLKSTGQLSPATLHRLFRYQEGVGDFAHAEDALYALRDAGGSPGLRTEALAFYGRLLALPDADLETGGLPREEVEEALAELNAADGAAGDKRQA